MRGPFTVTVLFLLSSGLPACGDDTSGGPMGPSGEPMDGSDGGTPPASPDLRPEEVPAVPLEADPAESCPGPYASSAPEEGLNDGFDAAGQRRSFELVLPSDRFEGPRPLFIAFNGTSENGPAFVRRAQLADFAERGFIVVAPSSNDNGTVWPVWDDMRQADDHDRENADLVYVDMLVDCLGGHFEVDVNRIYAGGHSAGGIMTNAFVQRRSDLLAGAIVASGVFDLTSPPDLDRLDDTFVIVTWGGPDDEYGGGRAGVAVPEINFVEQASLASQFYAEQPAVGHARCSLDTGGGHFWLDPLNDWFVDQLLAHPKGVSGALETSVEPSPVSGITCTAEPFVYEGGVRVSCPPGDVDGCQAFCQLGGDCAVENSTVGPILAPQLEMLGFSGMDNAECGGCVSLCGERATSAADTEVLSCIAEIQASAMCGAGISGAQPLIDAIETCCDGRNDSTFCVETCGTIVGNSAARSFFPNCVALVE